MKYVLVFALLSFATTDAHSQSYIQMMGKDASLEYDGKTLTYKSGKEVRKWQWIGSAQEAESLSIDAMIASAYLGSGGKLDFPSQSDMTSDDLVSAVAKAKSQALTKLKDPAAVQLITRLENSLKFAKTQLQMCSLYANQPQESLTAEDKKALLDLATRAYNANPSDVQNLRVPGTKR